MNAETEHSGDTVRCASCDREFADMDFFVDHLVDSHEYLPTLIQALTAQRGDA